MKWYQCSVSSCGKNFNVFSTREVFSILKKAPYLYRHLDLKVSSRIKDTPYSIKYTDGNKRVLRYTPDSVIVNFPWKEMCDGEVLLFVSSSFLEYQHQISGYVTIHGACVETNDGRGLLFLGKEGAGKTSIILSLCRSGARIVGNDLVLLGLEGKKVFAKTGSKFFFIRYKVLKLYFPDILSKFFGEVTDPWLSKVVIFPDKLEIEICKRKIRINEAYLVHLDSNQDILNVQNGDSLVTRLFLNENFSRYIRNSCTTLLTGASMEFSGYIPSFDTPECYQKRVALMNCLLKDVGIKYISGNLPDITNAIMNL